jgi:TP901 family phage tail tape measure protein
MALDIGELVGKLQVDDKGMDKGLKGGEKKFGDFGEKLTEMAIGAGIAVATAFGGAILANLNQDAIGASISAQLGGTAEDAKNYGKLAGKLYSENWGESVDQIGESIKEVAQAHILADGTPEELEAATRQAQILSDVFHVDVHDSVASVQNMIATGLVPSAREGFDLIAAGIQGGVDKAGDLTDTFTEYSTQFRELGINGYQAMGLLQQGLKGGARDADIVADALKEFAIRSKDASDTSIDGFKSLGLNGKQMTAIFAKGGPEAADGLGTVLEKLKAIKNPVEQARIATELFGTQSEDLGNALYNLNLDEAGAAFDNAAGSIERAGNAVSDTDAARLESFKRSAMATAQSIAGDLVPSLMAMGKWAQSNAAWLKPLVEILGAAAVVIVAVNLATKAWAATEAAFTAVKGVATAAQWLWNAALWASPITWIVAGILLLVGVIILIATKTTWFQDAWNWAWGGIKAAAAAVWGWISGTLWPGIVGFFSTMGQAAINVWHVITGAFGAMWQLFLDWKQKVSNLFQAVGLFIAAGIEYGRDKVRNAINAIIGFVNSAIGAINNVIAMANKVPGVNIGSVGSIPKLAGGGAVSPRPGGTPVIMGDGGQVEYGVPKSDMQDIIGKAVAASGGGHGEMKVVLELVGDGVLRIVRTEVKRNGVKTLERTP